MQLVLLLVKVATIILFAFFRGLNEVLGLCEGGGSGFFLGHKSPRWTMLGCAMFHKQQGNDDFGPDIKGWF